MNRYSFTNLTLFLILIISFLLACRPQSNSVFESKSSPKPEALIYEQSIEGVILGKRISEPFGLVSDMVGNVFLVDAGNNRLIWFDREYIAIRDVGGFGTDEGLLNSPSYISIDNNLNLYVTDGGNQRIAVYDTRLNYAKRIELVDESDPLRFGDPSGVKVNQYGELWVADKDRSKIWIFNNIGTFDRSIGGIESTGGFLLNPAGMTSDDQGNTLVCDKGNSLIKIYDSFGIFVDEFGYRRMDRPTGISVDKFGNIWVLDSKTSDIYCFDSDGVFIFSPEQVNYSGNIFLSNPVDLTVTADNKLIVSDSGNDRLLVFKILYP